MSASFTGPSCTVKLYFACRGVFFSPLAFSAPRKASFQCLLFAIWSPPWSGRVTRNSPLGGLSEEEVQYLSQRPCSNEFLLPIRAPLQFVLIFWQEPLFIYNRPKSLLFHSAHFHWWLGVSSLVWFGVVRKSYFQKWAPLIMQHTSQAQGISHLFYQFLELYKRFRRLKKTAKMTFSFMVFGRLSLKSISL